MRPNNFEKFDVPYCYLNMLNITWPDRNWRGVSQAMQFVREGTAHSPNADIAADETSTENLTWPRLHVSMLQKNIPVTSGEKTETRKRDKIMASENRWHKETSIGRRHSNFDGDGTLSVPESTVQEQSMIELLTNVIFMPLLATIYQRKKRYKLLVKLDFKSIKKSPTLKRERW